MAQIDVTDSELIIHMEGLEHAFLFLFNKNMSIPLEHVLGAEYDPQAARALYHGPKVFGTGVPTKGTFGVYVGDQEKGEMGLTFWDVSNPDNAIVVRLQHDKYESLVVGADDPRAAVQAINQAVAGRGAVTP